MEHTDRAGLLLLNLGTPDSPETADVRRYLKEFLSDPRVVDISGWRRWLILNLFILPFRPKQSGEAYAKMNTFGPINPLAVGMHFDFAYTTVNPYDFQSKTVGIDVLP